MKDKYVINFETKPISFEERKSKEFQNLLSQIKNILNQHIGEPISDYNTSLLFTEIEILMNEYKYKNPNSSFDIRPDSKYAFKEEYLTVKEIAELHKKHYDYHKTKSEYTNVEVNNMLFDLKIIGEVDGYMSPAVCYDIPSHNNKICNDKILVSKRIFNYR